jgi:hypothetical protein
MIIQKGMPGAPGIFSFEQVIWIPDFSGCRFELLL